VWLRNHQDGGWITLFWKYLHSAPEPFGELAWDHALAGLRERGENPAEPQIAAAAAALLERAAHGPPGQRQGTATARDRRVTARTRPAPPSLAPAAPPPLPAGQPGQPGDAADDEELAEVIPLGVFDARKEARQWW
jgi:hypothetical protein